MSSRRTPLRPFERPKWDFRIPDRNVDELPVRKVTGPDFNEKSEVHLARETVDQPKSIPTAWVRSLVDSRISFNDEAPVFVISVLVVAISAVIFLVVS